MTITRVMKIGMLAGLAGMMVFSLGAPALASTGQPGPTNPPKVSDPVSSVAEVQSWKIDGGPATGGTYKLVVNGTATSAMAYNVRDSEAEAAIRTALGGSSDVTVIAIRGVSYTVTFSVVTGTVGANVPQMTVTENTLTGPNAPYAITVTTVQDGAGEISGQVSPHGGYSSTTNFCVQCHAVHSYQSGPGTFRGGNEYALLQAASVTDTCNTCHALFGSSATGRIDSNAITGKPSSAGVMGTTSMRSAYDYAGPGGSIGSGFSGHQIGTATSPLPDDVVMNGLGWSFSFNAAGWYNAAGPAGPGSSSATSGGLYCGSCHTPHGDFGQLINSDAGGSSGTLSSGNPGYRSDANNIGGNAVQYIDGRELTTSQTYKINVFDPTLGTAVDDPTGYVTTGILSGASTAANVQGALDTALGAGKTTVVYALSATGSTSTAIGSASWAIPFYRVTFGGTGFANVTMPQMEPTGGSDPGKVDVITSVGGGLATSVSAPSSAGTSSTGPSSNSANGSIAAGARPWAEGQPIFQYKGASASPTVYYLHLDTTGISATSGLAPVWEKCDQSTTGAAQTVTAVSNAVDTVPYGTCSILTTVDSEGQTAYLYGYKLLTAYPNHDTLKPESWNMASRGKDQARWCGACHPSKVSPNFGVEGEFAVDVNGTPTVFHSHPTACYYCHGDPTDGSSADYPHTSTNGALLKEYPDALCVSCHTKGSLP